MPFFGENLEGREVGLSGWNSRPTPTNWVIESRIKTPKINFYSHKIIQATFLDCPLCTGHGAKPWGELPKLESKDI